MPCLHRDLIRKSQDQRCNCRQMRHQLLHMQSIIKLLCKVDRRCLRSLNLATWIWSPRTRTPSLHRKVQQTFRRGHGGGVLRWSNRWSTARRSYKHSGLCIVDTLDLMEFRCLVEDNAPAEEPILRSAVGTRDTVDSQWDVSSERETDKATETETETETETDRQTDREKAHNSGTHQRPHAQIYTQVWSRWRWPLAVAR